MIMITVSSFTAVGKIPLIMEIIYLIYLMSVWWLNTG